MSKPYIKPLDPFRPNVLPRLVTDGDSPKHAPFTESAAVKGSFSPASGKLESFSKTTADLKQTQTVTRSEVKSKYEQLRAKEEEIRREREKQMFVIDKASSFDAFALPGKPEMSTVLRADKKKSKTSTKIKPVEVVTDSSTVEVNEFSFLAGVMGAAPSPVRPDSVKKSSGADSPVKGGQTSDLDEVSEIMANIKTGIDAINFFARYGSDTPVKFVDLVQVDDPKVYRPYDLVAVNLHDVNMEHYTISSSGIVHVCPGEPSECISLSNWMRQGMMFNILRNIPFYRFFLHRKTFSTWRDNVRFQLFLKQRKKVLRISIVTMAIFTVNGYSRGPNIMLL